MADAVSARIWGAGSLRLPFIGEGGVFADVQPPPECRFGPSGTLAEAIFAGEQWDVYCSADQDHPRRLFEAGLAARPKAFASNRLAVLYLKSRGFHAENILGALLDPAVRIGMSTPGADPSGDYAQQLLARLGQAFPEARSDLVARSEVLTGGGERVPVEGPLGRYATIVADGHADVMLCYETICLDACARSANLTFARLPPAQEVGAVYGATVPRDSDDRGLGLFEFLFSEEAQARLAAFGFGPPPPEGRGDAAGD